MNDELNTETLELTFYNLISPKVTSDGTVIVSGLRQPRLYLCLLFV